MHSPMFSLDMDVSKNNGTPKSSILIRFSIINHPFWGTPIFGNIHIFSTGIIQFHNLIKLINLYVFGDGRPYTVRFHVVSTKNLGLCQTLPKCSTTKITYIADLNLEKKELLYYLLAYPEHPCMVYLHLVDS